jgi:hypothetical protein
MSDFVVEVPTVDRADVTERGCPEGVHLPANGPDAGLDLRHLRDLAVDAGVDDRVVEQTIFRTQPFEQESRARHLLVEEHALLGQSGRRAQHRDCGVAVEEDASHVLRQIECLSRRQPVPPVGTVERVQLADELAVRFACGAIGEVVGLYIDDQLVAAERFVSCVAVERGTLGNVEEFVAVRLVHGEESGRDPATGFDVRTGRCAKARAGMLDGDGG